ncbi:hypothetical protein D3P08_17175 [Paenibacillus nanensis]|uniref:Uncharacterized protein n=1 Tax=Paenibacillus nanensis TaxID=393251 RepID=A0A3A1URR8_9BACL|nr:hypothetical protein [Paenibacillus nanensis]RIX51208.1 hypothetical protein D3P08_17175 [Paenibacillus nanensis]
MDEQEQRVKLPDAVRHEGLVTERDIDPEFGLFTEEEKTGTAQPQKAEKSNASNKMERDGIGD